MTGGRIKRIQSYIGNETFCLTYGDGVSDVDIRELIEFHREQKTLATLTAVQPPGPLRRLALGKGQRLTISSFAEKPSGEMARGSTEGSLFLSRKYSITLKAMQTVWELEPMERLARSNNCLPSVMPDFGDPWTRLRDKIVLEEMWAGNKAPWKIWDAGKVVGHADAPEFVPGNGTSKSGILMTYDYAMIGGGIVGLATAMMLGDNIRQRGFCFLRRNRPAQHQTGRNSGVIHSGIYYKPGSFKASFAKAGASFDGRVLPGTRHSARGLRQSHRRHARKGTRGTRKSVSTRPAKRLAS